MNSNDIECAICECLVDDILSRGYLISVYDGEEVCLERSLLAPSILAAMFSTDSDNLLVYSRDGSCLGEIVLIYGNGRDVISDHSDTPEIAALLAGAYALAEKIGD